MRGVTTHVSVPKSSTDWTTNLKKNLDTRSAASSLLIILVNLRHNACAFARFMTTANQLSSAADITCPKYLKEVTISRGCPYVLKDLDVTTLSSSAAMLCCFRSAPFLHCAVRRFIPLKDHHVISMLHRGHRGWGRLPSSVSPLFPGHTGSKNTPAWLSATPPGHHTPQLGRASVLPFLGTSSKTSWYRHPLPGTCPKYLKEVTISRGCPYVLKDLDVTTLSSSAAMLCCFRSAPFLHCAVRRFIPLKDHHVISMLHRGHRGWGRLPSSVSPLFPGHTGSKNTPAWLSATPPGHHTPQLGRASVLPFLGTSSKTSWYRHPRLPLRPSAPPALLSCRAGFGDVKPVTPSLNPSRIPDIVPVPVASPGISAYIPSSGVCRPRLPGPRPPGMIGRPNPVFWTFLRSPTRPNIPVSM